MARDENPPFGRGETFYGGRDIDANNLGGLQHEGTVWEFEDVLWNQPSGGAGAKPTRSNRRVRCMIVRNVSGAALLPKRLVTLQLVGTDGRYALGRVDGYACVTGTRAYPLDEFLPTAGVPNNDLCYVVIQGPALVLTDLAGGANNVWSVGTYVDALTAATSGATTAGRVEPSLAAQSLSYNLVNLGWALSAATTANTNASLLMEVRTW